MMVHIQFERYDLHEDFENMLAMRDTFDWISHVRNTIFLYRFIYGKGDTPDQEEARRKLLAEYKGVLGENFVIEQEAKIDFAVQVEEIGADEGREMKLTLR